MTESETRGVRENTSVQSTLTSLFAVAVTALLLGLVLLHSYVVLTVDGPSTYDTLRTVWIGGIVLVAGLLTAELGT